MYQLILDVYKKYGGRKIMMLSLAVWTQREYARNFIFFWTFKYRLSRFCGLRKFTP